VPPLAGRRPGARRVAAAFFELGGDALAAGVRVVTGRGTSAPPVHEPHRDDEAPATTETAGQAAAAEEAAARLDAARERLRAAIAPPDDEDLSASAGGELHAPDDAEPSSAPPAAEA
jgi:hypothetical protein